MKKFLLIVFLLLLCAGQVQASPMEKIEEETDRQIGQVQAEQWDAFVAELEDEYGGIVELKPFAQTVKEIIANDGLNTESVFQIVIKCFTRQLPQMLAMLVKVVVLGILCAMLQRLEGSLGTEGVSKSAKFVVYALAMIVLFELFRGAVKDAVTALDGMTGFMEIILPILIVFLTSVGATASAGLMQPVSGIIFGIVGSAVKGLVIPLTVSGASVALVDRLSEGIKLGKLAQLLKTVAQWVLGVVFTVFIGVTAVKGLASSSFDGIFLRTAKFTVSGMIPIIGGMVGDGADLVIGCGLLVKNAIGVAGLGIIALIVAAPCIRLLALTLAMKGCAALLQPVAEEGLADGLNEMAGFIQLLMVAVLTCGLMLFLTVALTVAMGNTAHMLG